MKAQFKLETRQYCRGCGIALMVQSMLEPLIVDERNERHLLETIRHALKTLSNYKCPNCSKKTMQIDYYRELPTTTPGDK